MKSVRIPSLALAAVIAAACGPALEEPALFLSPDRSTFDGKTERVVVKVRAFGVGGVPAMGVVRLTAPVGHFVGGDQVELSEGFATATYACSPEEEAACSGPVRLAGEWESLHATTQVNVAAALLIAPVEWEVVSTNTLASLVAIAAAPDGSAWAVGEGGTVVQLIDRRWRVVHTPVRTTLRAVAFDGAGNPVVAGDKGVVLTWVSGGFQRLPIFDQHWWAVAVDREGRIHLGAASGLLALWSGGELLPQLDLGAPILGLAQQAGEVWASGEGKLARFSGGQWMNLPMPLNARLSVVQAGPTGLWLAGAREASSAGVVLRGPHPAWLATTLPEPVHALAEVPGVPERFALTHARLYRQLEDEQWEPIALPARAAAMTSRAKGDLVLVGPPGFSLLRAR